MATNSPTPASSGLTNTDLIKYSIDKVMEKLFTEMLEDIEDEGDNQYVLSEKAKLMAHAASGWNPPAKGSSIEQKPPSFTF
jgi:hypothetical protein